MTNSSKHTNRFNREDIESLKGKDMTDSATNQDPFTTDAIEGWEALNFDSNNMEGLDDKFLTKTPKLFTVKNTLLLATSILSIVFISLFLADKKQKNVSVKETKKNEIPQTITIETSDLVLPEEIANYSEVKSSEQITPDQIQNEFQLIKDVQLKKIDKLPVRNVQPIDNDNHSRLNRNRSNGKEIYLHNYKLLDYSNYRPTEKIKTEQTSLSGTPANQESIIQPNQIHKNELHINYMEYLSKTISYFNDQDYRHALVRLDIILEHYPNDINALFYKGLCLFNFGEYNACIEIFKTCRNNEYSNFDEESTWYLATCYKRTGASENANALYKELIQTDSFYKSQAEKQLK